MAVKVEMMVEEGEANFANKETEIQRRVLRKLQTVKLLDARVNPASRNGGTREYYSFMVLVASATAIILRARAHSWIKAHASR